MRSHFVLRGKLPMHEQGRDEYLRRLAHRFWFQSFGAVMGMNWHYSAITTSVLRLISEERERSHAYGGRSVFG